MADVEFFGSATLGSRGQVAIPAALRRELKLRGGDHLLFLKAKGEDSGFLAALPAPSLQGDLPLQVWHALEDETHGTTPVRDGQAATATDEGALATLRSIDMFRELDEDVLRRIAPLMKQRRYARGEMIVREGEPCEAFYSIVSGLVKRYKLGADGQEQVLKMMGPGETFNEVPLLDGGPNPAWAEAMEDADLYVVDRRDFAALLEHEPRLCIGLVRELARRLRHLVGLVEDLSLRQTASRLARLLLEQPEMAGRLTQQEMAAMIGTVREVVGRALRVLEEAGAVRMARGRVEVADPEILRSMG
ncbi:MAG: cyclic nucleotide-binding domain-containing protein [Dehalococcoidia bacterium]